MAEQAEGTIRRGTTPTITAQLNADVTGWPVVILSVRGAGQQLDLTGDRLTIAKADPGCTVSATLTQEETLAMQADLTISVQVRARDSSGKAVATSCGRLKVLDVLNDCVI